MVTYKKITVEDVEMSEEDIFEQRKFRVLVAGVARSGTSMMSGIVERLGVNFFSTTDTEEEKEKRRLNELKRFGEDFKMNEDFYEVAKDVWRYRLKLWSEDYSGQKILLPVSRMHPSYFINPCRVIQMWRDPEEIRQSQQASYNGEQIMTPEQCDLKRAELLNHLVGAKTFFDDRNIPSLDVEYREILVNPKGVIEEIAKFINAPNPIDEAVAWVNPDKNRFKKEELTKDI
jgi:hypothetical protein